MRYEPNDEDRRRERAYEGFGTREPRCSAPGCSETDWRLLTGSEPDELLCYEHLLMAQGRSPVELQHPAGRHNDPEFTVPFLGNLHRLMDEPKRDWPERTLRNPDGSPMLRAAACVRGVLDWLRLIIDRMLSWVPPLLEAVDERLTELSGPGWWRTLGLPEAMLQ